MNLGFGWPRLATIALHTYSDSEYLDWGVILNTFGLLMDVNTEFSHVLTFDGIFNRKLMCVASFLENNIFLCISWFVLFAFATHRVQFFHSFFTPSKPLEALCLLFFPPQNSCFEILRRLRVVTWVENLGFAIILHL